MKGFDDETQKLIGAQADAVQGAKDLAAMLTAFRADLIVGGFDPEKAADMAHDYLSAMLDARAANDD